MIKGKWWVKPRQQNKREENLTKHAFSIYAYVQKEEKIGIFTQKFLPKKNFYPKIGKTIMRKVVTSGKSKTRHRK